MKKTRKNEVLFCFKIRVKNGPILANVDSGVPKSTAFFTFVLDMSENATTWLRTRRSWPLHEK